MPWHIFVHQNEETHNYGMNKKNRLYIGRTCILKTKEVRGQRTRQLRNQQTSYSKKGSAVRHSKNEWKAGRHHRKRNVNLLLFCFKPIFVCCIRRSGSFCSLSLPLLAFNSYSLNLFCVTLAQVRFVFHFRCFSAVLSFFRVHYFLFLYFFFSSYNMKRVFEN